MIPNRLCSSYFSVTVLCALSYTIKRIVAHRRASQAIHGRIPCPWQNAQNIPTVHIPYNNASLYTQKRGCEKHNLPLATWWNSHAGLCGQYCSFDQFMFQKSITSSSFHLFLSKISYY